MSFGRSMLAILRCHKCGKALGEVRNCDLEKLKIDCQDCRENDNGIESRSGGAGKQI
jgi:phage FluMu protein Com